MFIYNERFIDGMSNGINYIIKTIKNMYECAIIYTIVSLGEGWSINF